MTELVPSKKIRVPLHNLRKILKGKRANAELRATVESYCSTVGSAEMVLLKVLGPPLFNFSKFLKDEECTAESII